MGCKFNNCTVEVIREGVGYTLFDDPRKADKATVAVRTKAGIDTTFYVDLEDGRLVITPESFYRKDRPTAKRRPA